MSKNFIKKNIKLSLELDRYLTKHPEAFDKIPNKACLMITVKGDDDFNRESKMVVKIAKDQKQKCVEARKEGIDWVLEPFFA
ncbi:MAG: DUF5647 family protein [Candidatus Omnitrophota bacterium]|jgi:hypothetical protein